MNINLDPDSCYRAIQTKDVRFDGRIFVGVRTTGIFCRPICPAQTPNRENCQFFANAATAYESGFRPCLRCRPELSPNLLSQVGTAATVSRSLRLIAAGALNDGTVAELAARVGVSDRHLRKLFMKHLGTSPIAVAQTQRLLFAKQLLDETSLSITDVAMAAGFSSLRRFNTVIRETYQRSPTELRNRLSKPGVAAQTPDITIKLPFSPPYHWAAFTQFLSPRVTPGLEAVGPNGYRRTIVLDGVHGVVEIRPVHHQNYLIASIRFAKVARLAQIVERLRRLLDLDAHVSEIAAHLQQDARLGPVVLMFPGLRIPGAWDAFELAIRAILGQQVSVAAATTLAGRLVRTYGDRLMIDGMPWVDSELQFVFPHPERLATADLTAIGIPRSRAIAITTLAATVAENHQFLTRFQSLEDAVHQLSQLPGIGEWTAHYIAMRGLREPDAFPAADLGLLRAMQQLGHSVTKAELLALSQAWHPWRDYAAMVLWSSLNSTVSTQEKQLA
ncbi:MAG: DNA-3-methyladenine glycosylase 2 family protein [Leptolyngbyaceae cyanobacterium RU_5_1]|nr:DNA-3-methyladenine glycosylase 2 family protein [Leptolyngbyaceae cyanobacterium RU_5_1]